MKHWHRLLVTTAVIACALLAASPALAKKPPRATDAKTALATVKTEVVGSNRLGTPAAPADSLTAESAGLQLAACYWVQVRRWGSNVFGMTLWTYYQRIEWCSSGGKITSVTRIRWGEVSMPGWSFNGHIGSTTGGGKGSTFYRARTQGHFCLIQYFSCVQNAYPWIDITVYANGTYKWSTGG